MKKYQAGDFRSNKHAEKVTIHLIFNGSSFELPDGTAFDMLNKGAAVELRVNSSFLNAEARASNLRKMETRELLPARSIVFARVDLRGIHEDCYNGFANTEQQHLDFASRATLLKQECCFVDDATVKPHDGLVRMQLEAPLVMTRTGLKTFKLEPCDCVIWNLKEHPIKARSLNHALTLISEFAEIDRISHTGNAFLRCLVALDDPMNPQPQAPLAKLAVLRDR